MVTALYRRYRPENFAEMIGQSQVTDPLMTALRTNRVNHAYLFSGPRGCGKTTSARILARCLNCAEGPTDTPCGVCPSCVELSRDGMGSLDVVEIDAASHGGVDDARDLRERAVFAPARDRFKIFIIDEAHMVTSGGFNALLKIVEEPPEHIKFIFATTEPDKVIGTIRSRTHHYPFRLIPPAQLLEYVQQLCDAEGVEVAPGVLPLVVRAGGGSARDTLSLLDQLIAGSENNRVEYERAVALLGYTHGALLSEAIDALGTHDGAAAFDAVDRVIQTGQDPRRFVEDLLERLRDIIVVEATREQASAVLRGVPADEIEVMRRQAGLFGHAELSRVADIVNTALTEMTGATSPRLHLELMVARALVPASDDTQRGALARVERLERRIGVDGPDAAQTSHSNAPAASRALGRPPVAAPQPGALPPAATPVPAASSMSDAPARPSTPAPAAASMADAPPRPSTPAAAPARDVPVTTSAPAPATGPDERSRTSTATPAASSQSTPSQSAPTGATSAPTRSASTQAASTQAASTQSAPTGPSASSGVPAPATASSDPRADGAAAVPPDSGAAGPDVIAVPASVVPIAAPAEGVLPASTVTLQQLKDAWPEILEVVQKAKRTAWLVVFTAHLRALDGDVLTLAFPSENDVASFKERSAPGEGVSEYLRQAILDVLGLRVKYIARVDGSLRPHDEPAAAPLSAAEPVSAPAPVSGPSPAPGAAPAPAPASDEGPDLDDTDEEPPLEEDLPPEPRAVVDPSGWAVPGLTENTPTADAPVVSGASAESGSAEVARMREQLASLTKNPQPGRSAPPRSPNDGAERPASRQDTTADRSAQSGGGQGPDGQGRQQGRQSAPQPAPNGRAQQPAPRSAQDGAAQRPTPTTSWDVVAIPNSSDDEAPLYDEPMPSDEPDLPPSLADVLPSAGPRRAAPEGANRPAERQRPDAVSTPGPAGRTDGQRPDAITTPGPAGRTGGPDPSLRPGALRFEASGPEASGPDTPAAPPSASASPSAPSPSSPASSAQAASASAGPTPGGPSSAGGRLRYGEAVVREILGANFIEEQPLPGREG